MPKIRNKNSGNINKSGALTQTYKSYYKVDQEKYSFFKREVNHSTSGNNIENVVFDDSKTILFVQKNLNPTLSLDDRHTNKLLSTPNTFPDEATVQTSVLRDKDYYNFSIAENHTENDYNIYKDGFFDNAVVDKKENIVINFERNPITPVHLSSGFSGGTHGNTTGPNYNITYSNINQFPRPTNSHTAYLSKEDSSMVDYLNDVTNNMYSDVNTFVSSSIPFSGYTSTGHSEDNPIYLTNYNIPIQDFGFPYEGKFRPKDRHEIKVENYIKKPFVIEKVILKTNISNWSVSDVESSAPCLNYLNFFIINQRGRLNSISLSQNREVKYFDDNLNSLQNITKENKFDDKDYTQKWSRFYVAPFSGGYKWQKVGNIETETNNITNSNETSQRELITNISILNYARNNSVTYNPFQINDDFISNDVDLVVNKTGATQQIDNTFAECIYQNLPVNIVSNVKNFKKFSSLPRFSQFQIYPKRKGSERTNIGKRSERSLKNELSAIDSEISVGNDKNNQSITTYNPQNSKNSLSNEYVIYPEDTLTFGINLSSSYSPGFVSSTSNISQYSKLKAIEIYNADYSKLYGRDVVHINGDISFTLVGYYLQNEEEKTISHKSHYENANMKRVGYSFNEVVDEFGQPEIYLSKGSYYDLVPNNATAGTQYLDLSANYYSRREARGFGNFLNLPNNNFLNLTISRNPPLANYAIPGLRYKENENSNNYKHIAHYFRLDKFGQPAYKINNNRYIQHEDMSLNNKLNFFINKKYKKGLFIEKSLSSGDIFNSYNTTQRASYTDAQIAFKELKKLGS